MSASAYYKPSEYQGRFHTSSSAAPASSAHRPSAGSGDVERTRSSAKLRLAMIAAVMMIGCFGLGALVHAFAGDGEVQAAGIPAVRDTVVVKPGDTLWSISEQRVSKGDDIRAYIVKLKKANGLSSSSIQAGQVLQLP
ncbi:LysM peptidoglycan-binding domain-containing protein [Paenibacillus sp. GYB003]|uniref:LysM peptidoglycan-binding domain-containing protein n=1 Tax=Paenibacillus sp. GYB003 TaxID=2994392 RepID=UPI002F962143